MTTCPDGKSSWPELVGVHGEAAAAIIERENLNVKAGVVKEGTLVTTDFRCDRVRVWVDSYGIKDEDTDIPYELNYIREKDIYKNEIAAYVYCKALDVGNTSSQNYEEMSNPANNQIAFGNEKCRKELEWEGD
ncbi:hypothetical protein VitviT2T_006650 [Vitis vinifera]|uniref:Uncharacterized protein n=1 Tax=Vitis vinifera TaxID=29760 RepID=A0ABY9BWN9_VITVI|nr:hypothetical protein VitviT2T_006650 [Vitis vinifera]